MKQVVVIGAGPAGLMAADVISAAGHSVLVAEAKPSPARKLLMAGKSGLNLTKAEGYDDFLAAYGDRAQELRLMLEAFGPDDVQAWAEGLGQDLFTGSTGRVFPKVMKASPLLRNWLARLEGQGVEVKTRWRWAGWQGDALQFETPDGMVSATPDATVLACGGASWARLGSDGAWAALMPETEISPFQPSNAALSVTWSGHMAPHFGAALKAVRWQAGDLTSRGEAVISVRGLEGGGLYPLTPALREGVALFVDLLPDIPLDQLRKRLSRPRGKASLSNHLRKTLKLPPVKLALLMEFARPLPDDLAPVIKALPVPYTGLRPMDEAISTAGGLRFNALNQHFMLSQRPGTFAAGEMLDWEAPTGGYLLTACLATGRWAGLGAVRYLSA
ncbi:TIGR03862 family flavoprotein [Roseovarius sp. EL26]|uniref:TIGR03862 family flavoprotein n=1 Tax=Roseovarius sp. EL26 TaxID=2126672 RepID=UPI000EA0BD57|nr:TIGR03862 family flavoprotein [Roseovarius sp. EL26]